MTPNGRRERDTSMYKRGTHSPMRSGLSKGQPVHIEGALGQDQWTDTDGKQHSRILIEASKVEVRELKREKAEARDQEAGVEL